MITLIKARRQKATRRRSPFIGTYPLKNAGEGGFTLVEVLIAMIVLSIGILALTMMLKQSVSSTDYGRRVTVAENIALQTVEQLKVSGYDSIPASGVSPSAGTPHTFTTVVLSDYGNVANPDFRTEIDCEVISGWSTDTPQGFLKKLTVTVRWRSVGSMGQGGSVTLGTFVSR